MGYKKGSYLVQSMLVFFECVKRRWNWIFGKRK